MVPHSMLQTRYGLANIGLAGERTHPLGRKG